MKYLFSKEDKKGIILWIASVLGIYIMGFCTHIELIISIIGIFPIIAFINLINLIITKINNKKGDK